MRKEIGTCIECRYWDERKFQEARFKVLSSGNNITKTDFFECKKEIFTPLSGKWGCLYWKEAK